MKKITKLLAFAAIAALPFAFTSCDDDDYWYDDGPWYGYNDPWWYDYYGDRYGWDNGYYNGDRDDGSSELTIVDEAQVLNGEWDGQMLYTNGDDGTQDQFYANMTFVQNSTNATKGTGTEYDYYKNEDGSIGQNQTLKFSWYIDDNGDIYIRYSNTGSTFVLDMDAKEHGFYLDEDKGLFNGYMIGTNNKDLIQFDFNRVTSNAKANITRATGATPATTVFGSPSAPRITTTGKMSLPKNR